MYSVNTSAIRHRFYEPLGVFWYPQTSLCDAVKENVNPQRRICSTTKLQLMYLNHNYKYLGIFYKSKPSTNLTIWSWERAESESEACGRDFFILWGVVKKEVFFKKVICGFADLVCLRIVDERRVESVRRVQRLPWKTTYRAASLGFWRSFVVVIWVDEQPVYCNVVHGGNRGLLTGNLLQFCTKCSRKLTLSGFL